MIEKTKRLAKAFGYGFLHPTETYVQDAEGELKYNGDVFESYAQKAGTYACTGCVVVGAVSYFAANSWNNMFNKGEILILDRKRGTWRNEVMEVTAGTINFKKKK